ncbi:MAG: S8 family serine peptidase [Solirubrobacterales bacterium]
MNRIPTTTIRLAAAAVALAGALALPAVASALEYVPGEVVVSYEPGQAPAGVAPGQPVVVPVDNVRRAVADLKGQPGVEYAVPNVIARAARARSAQYLPNDPEMKSLQWNFLGPYGVRAPEAWANAIAAGRPGGQGVVIAVLDTGVAYSNRTPFRRSPDFTASQFKRGYDYVDRDSYPNDDNGHGTHVAGTIAEATNNGIAVAGLAYGAKIMPVRVLDANGEGNANDIARGVRFAVKNNAKLINLSLEFDSRVRASDIPQILDALDYARSRGVLVVGATGNEGANAVSYPARSSAVMAVGSTTEDGCISEFSNGGSGIDIVGPGGGLDARVPGDQRCRQSFTGRGIYQVTLLGKSLSRFGLPGTYEGTSMAAPHVTATAALVIATGVLGPDPAAPTLQRHLQRTARDFGLQGPDSLYGWGLLDAAQATAK